MCRGDLALPEASQTYMSKRWGLLNQAGGQQRPPIQMFQPGPADPSAPFVGRDPRDADESGIDHADILPGAGSPSYAKRVPDRINLPNW